MKWFNSYLADRMKAVVTNSGMSSITQCQYGVSQDSVLGPVLFTLYTSPIASIMSQHGASHSAYADDVNALAAIDHDDLEACAVVKATAAVRDWYADNGMLLNASKSEAILVGTRARLSKFEKNTSVTVAEARVKCGESLTSLGVVIDPQLSFEA